MSIETFRCAIDEASGFATEVELFGGGEPLLHPRISEMVGYAKRAGLRTRIHTNATLLTDSVARTLILEGLDYLSISFDGYTKSYYEEVRKGAKYETTLNNIISFLNVKSGLGSATPYTVVQSIESPTKPLAAEQVKAKADLRSLLLKVSLDEISVITQHNYGGKIPSVSGGNLRYSPCTFPYYTMNILFDGTIVPCCVDWHGEYSLGTVGADSLTSVWNGPRLANLRQTLAAGHYLDIPLCATCDRLWRPSTLGVPYRSLRVVKSFVARHLRA